ncbi:MAG TPA: choice-of-anchor B family protein [Chloroflexota bacterium]|nr:choice-of-anchor B family protein [Chloroflexota bacterium]HUM69186.1 choice-of-anchor B family protein [Chloroflexota bacterium]
MSHRLNRVFWLTAVLLLATITLIRQQQLMAQSSGSTAAVCQNGTAAGYPCDRVDLLSFVSKMDVGATITNSLVANLWGWTDPETDKEYVMLGLQEGTAFIDVSNPYTPTYLGLLPSHFLTATLSPFRDMKVYQNYAYIIADAPSQNGMQIFDLTTLRGITTPTTFSETAHYDGIVDGHNIFIHEATGYAYVVRRGQGGPCNTGTTMIDLQDPLNPVDAGCYPDGNSASDISCVLYHGPDADYQGREICLLASDDNLLVGDVTSKTTPVTLETLTYNHATRIHSAWFTEDHRYFLSVDMDDEHHYGLNTRIFIWDALDLDNIPDEQDAVFYLGPTTGSDHNIWIVGDYAYIGNLRAGLRILDLRHIADGTLTQAAYFDNFAPNNFAGHEQGAWAVYPYFESGVVAISDRTEGLILVRPLLEQTFLPLVSK